MYYVLSHALTRRFIEELRGFWSYHPRYRDDLVNNIQGKYSFDERPQHGIIVKNSGGSLVKMAADNFMGTVHSYAYLTKVDGFNGTFIEWIREDAVAIQQNHGKFPSKAGVYYIEVTSYDENTGLGEFYVDSLLDVRGEQVTMVDNQEGTLQRKPLDGTLSMYRLPSNLPVQHYQYNETDNSIRLVKPLAEGHTIVADYRYPAPSIGPIPFKSMRANNTAIPGVVLGFGREVEAGDRLAVVVSNRREPAYQEFGGRWSLGIDIDVISRDIYSQREIIDRTVTYVFGTLRPRLSTEGIEILDINLGGEMEEVYDETGDEYFYNASFSMTVETEWSIHVPLGPWIRSVSSIKKEDLAQGEANPTEPPSLRSLGLRRSIDPFIPGRNSTYEVIK